MRIDMYLDTPSRVWAGDKPATAEEEESDQLPAAMRRVAMRQGEAGQEAPVE
jgi:hypothetical protein